MSKKFFLTTAIPYESNPHCGHALEYVMADVVHRYHEIKGDEVFFVSGADENALKNVQAAEKVGMKPAEFLDKYAKVFQDFYSMLEADLDEFRRGTDQVHHWPGVQELWKLADKNGDIYKKNIVVCIVWGVNRLRLRLTWWTGNAQIIIKSPNSWKKRIISSSCLTTKPN
jgi:methionyl-tRNA synthetase